MRYKVKILTEANTGESMRKPFRQHRLATNREKDGAGNAAAKLYKTLSAELFCSLIIMHYTCKSLHVSLRCLNDLTTAPQMLHFSRYDFLMFGVVTSDETRSEIQTIPIGANPPRVDRSSSDSRSRQRRLQGFVLGACHQQFTSSMSA